MCIIVYIPYNVEIPDDDILMNCWANNPDGAGLMYRRGHQVVIEKGMMTVDSLLDKIDKMRKMKNRDDLCLHFRFATHGLKNEGNTHPFPITHKIAELTATDITCKMGVAHNGIIQMILPKNSQLSDTMHFIKKIDGRPMAHIKSALKKSRSKYCLMTGKDTTLIGKFTKEDGIYYSNDSFMFSMYTYYGEGAYSLIDDTVYTAIPQIIQNYQDYIDSVAADHNINMLDLEDMVYESLIDKPIPITEPMRIMDRIDSVALAMSTGYKRIMDIGQNYEY